MHPLAKTFALMIAAAALPASATAQTAGTTATSPNPQVTAPSPADSATVGRAPGFNPVNPQDLTARSNPQDLTVGRGGNAQDNLPPIASPAPIVRPER